MSINNLSLFPASGKIDNQFIGIKVFKNQIEFYYPETYHLSTNDNDLRRDILAILRTISLAKTKTSDASSYYTSHKKENAFPLGAFLWIINDYLTYGRYENREKTYEPGIKGRINWKRTMHSAPVISNGNLIYKDFISERKSQKDNLLTEIYFFCVQKAVDSIGWLYGVTFDSNGIDYNRLFNRKRYQTAVNYELAHTFDDYKKNRLQNMKSIIVGLDDDIVNTNEMIYGVDSYDYVFEKMVDSMFSKVENIKEFYPQAEWKLELESESIPSSKLRPDTVIVRIDPDTGKKTVYIIDAKYYRYGTTFNSNDLPETTSIQKQITYGEYIKRISNSQYDAVYSAFVLPYSKDTNIHKNCFCDNLVFVGIGTAKWFSEKENTESLNRQIAAILIDTKYLINNWGRRNDDDIDKLISLIEQHIRNDNNA